ncbi:ankyrin repeat and LEM domain-containing protein 2 [Brienomyrus brachyistius]|uniref:ankyrin repeat and LEM domain-containing protein 2 n=1 Tax=Brienomyrus brachyistius TaxID=42636 RepID=UPI0020B21DCA|nr:ankyrin repeat and LEM domain-containing protein 2 [Brienomyrus brachyistius]XP_048850189.1 ankyrin repeat and LEM domain-containing protein 2 [Brienomyrus brachyistius]XP_048850197.1 ankyrin repeat and LEM domain-containing protein 2 [Brienomyrus brachyistius]
MEAILSRLRELSADQLREEIIGANLMCGPITGTTRATFERRLARAILGNSGGTSERDGGGAATCASTSSTVSAQDSQEVSRGGDFGYDLGLNPPEEEALLEKPEVSRSVQVEDVTSQAEGQDPPKTPQTSPTVYYGVCPLTEDVLARSDRVHVYTDKKEAMQAVKTMKGARFKPFSNREDAEKFAKGICDYCPSPSKFTPCVSPGKPGLIFYRDGPSALEAETINRERANSFKSPRTQDLTAKLRKAVEKGDQVAFSDLVWSNPRYLIGSGDNPTVVQEGCRYNVMHVAAKENQPGIAQLLLDTLENPDFMRLMYPDDQEGMLQKRIRYIVDLYLNTPDKAGFETPLHFACKFGCPEVVNVLCSHPDTDKNCKNKYDKKPCEVICERKHKNQEEIMQKISDHLEDRCFIPLLRATDNSLQPVIGGPWSPEPSEGVPHSLIAKLPGSPKDPVMAVRAFAGPLSPSKADEFRRVWKTPPRDRAEYFHNIRKSDPDRGAERVGRDLAHELGHPWAEYWEFLGGFVDLSTAEGLRKLEEHLSQKEEAGENETSNRFKTPSPGKPKKFCNSISVGAFLDEGDDISLEEIKNRQNAALTSITAVCGKDSLKGASGGLEFHILPVSRSADLIEMAAEQDCLLSEKGLPSAEKNGLCSPLSGERTQNGERIGRGGASPSLLSPISNLMVEFERMSLQDAAESRPAERWRCGAGVWHREAQDSTDVLQSLTSLVLSDKEEPTAPRLGGRDDVDGIDRSLSSSEEYFTPEESVEAASQRTGSVGSERPICARSRSWDHGGRDLSSSGSTYKSLESSHMSRTPPQAKKVLFIEGESPTKLDREVLLAIGDRDIDPQKYPSVHKWRNMLQSFSASEMQSWPSPTVDKSRLRLQTSTPGSSSASFLSTPGRSSPARHAASPDWTSPGRHSSTSYIQRVRHKYFGEPAF